MRPDCVYDATVVNTKRDADSFLLDLYKTQETAGRRV